MCSVLSPHWTTYLGSSSILMEMGSSVDDIFAEGTFESVSAFVNGVFAGGGMIIPASSFRFRLYASTAEFKSKIASSLTFSVNVGVGTSFFTMDSYSAWRRVNWSCNEGFLC